MKFVKYLFIIAICCFFLGIGAIFGLYKYLEPELPDVSTLKEVRLQTPMQVFSADGDLIAQFGEKRRIPLTLKQMPPQLLHAFIATEDSRFYEHHGLDPIGIARAVVVALGAGSAQQGASTITQQLARNFFLSPEKTVIRKAKEAFLAIRIERSLSKDEILELYLNKIYLGSRAYGVGAAAQVYFGKDVNQLTLSEMAMLAGLPKAPSSYNPINNPEKALMRRNTVLYRMLEEKYITQQEYSDAKSAPLVANYHEPEIAFSAPYLAEMVRQEMFDKYGENAYTDGYKVYTTVTKTLQTTATDAVRNNIIQYDMRHGYRGPAEVLWKASDPAWEKDQIVAALKKLPNYGPLIPAVVTQTEAQQAIVMLANGETQALPFSGMRWARPFINDRAMGASPRKVTDAVAVGQQIWIRKGKDSWLLAQVPSVNSALVSLDPNTGAVKAVVGGFDFNQSKFNRVTQSVRQVGSNIKPFVYAAALDRGMTLSTILTDLPISMPVGGGKIWSPKNSPPRYDGPLRLRVGLGLSKNVMIVRVMRAIGVDYAADYLQRFGFPAQNISRTESLALGAASFTPLQLARGYAVFANGGYLIDPYFIAKIESDDGKVIFEAKPKVACGFDCDIPVIYGTTEKSQALVSNTIDLSKQKEEMAAAEAANANTPNANGEEENDEEVDQVTESAVNDISPVTDLKATSSNQPQATEADPYAPHVISSDLAFLMQDALKSNIAGEPGGGWNGTGWRAARDLKRSDIGGKTGTTNGSKDAWFSGFGPSTVTSVWIGFDDHRRSLGRGEAGAQSAQPAWIDFMKAALEGLPIKKTTPPKGIVSVTIDMSTGQLPSSGKTRSEFFMKGTEPTSRAYSEVGTTVTDSGGNSHELF
ncbi:carboxypeptidase/penicillin-binding protein 1A [Leminorella grimontii]|uniref:Penicillin-binding protein 1A n=1 Tax=Leminorella grimontii TaxID=82981 RepID=A0AAV5N1B7_9GAMM|nr:PBP1A family penicillin-binding protein [Leminorella grimontii]KFC93765.1 multimodular transpeptidase-transglycosylase [Leminorella grimontii ATCC 33999 = DSM 5078]GKX55537.1 carboxypeptidase/penicillin-binding protein 1A [Leminorella grimontii]GKX59346.1 carboxypeptidase/penicillin-binding protein 1A [Leminorella grimontii]VFS55662.1 Penicillin-binding protein 1A [Leminorella grimontii]